jgi:hypothetical protein
MTKFPAGLLDWAGDRSGGVRRLFHDGSGRPSQAIIDTPLLRRLTAWAQDVAATPSETPRVVLLVGGPGNGKTEAIETAIRALDDALKLNGALESHLRRELKSTDQAPVPRLATAKFVTASNSEISTLVIVQDASVKDSGRPGVRPPQLLIEDIEKYALAPIGTIYLSCVNRGILDDALILALNEDKLGVATILSEMIRAVGVSPDATSCWPMERYPNTAIWPMDVETLIGTAPITENSPAHQLLEIALSKEHWPDFGTCPAEERCPYCNSRRILATAAPKQALLTVLRWYELATGKRWTFRDMNSLISYLFAGASTDDTGGGQPCEWAARQKAAMTDNGDRNALKRQLAPFNLMASQYQHALFGTWSLENEKSLRRDLVQLERQLGAHLRSRDIMLGLIRFLSSKGTVSVPKTLRAQIPALSEYLDPALAEPETELGDGESGKTLRDLDIRFSQSIRSGTKYVKPHRWLTALETDLLDKLADADDELATAEIRRAGPAAASRLQAVMREFACRMVRRSLGVRFAFTRDSAVLKEYQQVANGERDLLRDAAQGVERLLHENDRFEIHLNTTFGEPLPPRGNRAVLRTTKQRVKAREVSTTGRPSASMRFLSIGSTDNPPLVPLTYELYRAVRALRHGLLRASLPRTVIALLDTTRARIAGAVVRDPRAFDDAEIFLGERPEVISREDHAFVVHVGEK